MKQYLYSSFALKLVLRLRDTSAKKELTMNLERTAPDKELRDYLPGVTNPTDSVQKVPLRLSSPLRVPVPSLLEQPSFFLVRSSEVDAG
jgi:hypothetical protein